MPNVTRHRGEKGAGGQAETIDHSKMQQRNNKQTVDKEADGDSEQYSDPDGAGLS